MPKRNEKPFNGKITNPDFYVDKEKGAYKLRTRERANGNFVIYIDSYIKGQRKCEALKGDDGQPLYLVPENGRNDSINKNRNRKTWEKAKATKAELIVFGQSTEKEKTEARKSISVLRFIEECRDEKGISRSQAGRIRTLYGQFEAFAAGQDITFADVDKDLLYRLMDFLRNKAVYMQKFKDNPPRLGQNTQVLVMKTLSAILSKAVDKGYLEINPYFQIGSKKRIHNTKAHINYLEIDEVQRLINTPCKYDVLKRAFLFSCSTGLRFSDVTSLKWGDIYQNDFYGMAMRVKIQKTKEPETFPLPKPALHFLPERSDAPDNEIIFPIKYDSRIGMKLQTWVDDAGIKKKIRFHSSRHTAAMTTLYLCKDIATVSKLLGHADIKTTQIYAEAMNESMRRAANLQDNIFKF